MTTIRRVSLLLLMSLVIAVAAVAQPPDDDAASEPEAAFDPAVHVAREAMIEKLYDIQHHKLWLGALTRRQAWLEAQETRRREASARKKADAEAPRPSRTGNAPGRAPETATPSALQGPGGSAQPFELQGVPPNVRANDPSADEPTAAQSEVSIGLVGDRALISWNDAPEAFFPHLQGFGTSTNGGQSWIDLGTPPVPPSGWALFRWRGDPVVAVNERSGDFYLFGIGYVDRDHPTFADSSALLMGRGRFSRGLDWHDIRVVQAKLASDWFLDKEWACVDSVTGNVYVIYTEFDKINNTNAIKFTRSTNLGVSWSSPVTLSSPGDAGDVQGARVAVGPDGEVYTVWYHNDPATAKYNLRFRRSLDGGSTFQAQSTAATYVANSGTGAPGFNRSRGIDMPSLAVDRTTGQYRGRVYLGFSESYDYGNDVWTVQPPANTVVFEVEPNNSTTTATPFVLGQTLRGGSYSGDADWYRCTLTAGQNVVVWVDSLPTGVAYLKVFAADGVEQLAYGEGGNYTTGFIDLLYTFTAPYTGTYYLRLVGSSNSSDRQYRLRTKAGVRETERGRDRRDAFVAWSNGGTGGFSPPVRVNDNAVGSDEYLPEVIVSSEGLPYLFWYDQRLDPQGARTHIYFSRSNDAGGTWLPNKRLSDANGSFSISATNMTPNMGDYIAAAASASRLVVGWGDARGTDVDVWTESFPNSLGMSACAGDTTVPAGSTFTRWANFTNQNPFYPDQYTFFIGDDRGWVSPTDAYFSLAPEETQPLNAMVEVPASAPQGTIARVCIVVSTSAYGTTQECCFKVTVGPTVSVSPAEGVAFGLRSAAPTPSRGATQLTFGLPAGARARLTVYDVTGALVRTLMDGDAEAGWNTVQWDGRDARGHVVAPGVYYVRLQAGGRSDALRVVLAK